MKTNISLYLFLFFFIFLNSCKGQLAKQSDSNNENVGIKILPGANQTENYLPLLKDNKVGLVVNQTSTINQTHLLDTLIKSGVVVEKLFSPEHGIRGNVADGELINNSIDAKTGIPIISLYGSNKKPTSEQLKGLDVVVFDLQDVGTRFYTYISTLTYVMEACAENDIKLIVLDRPNPNGFYIDGPVLEPANSSFVGLHQVPIVYGMTIGEYALMVNGEKWLKDNVLCNLNVIPCHNYTHDSIYKLPISPSPNLPTQESILLYPSLCLFEGTIVSVGRGTDKPFESIGHPEFAKSDYFFTPKRIAGVSENPPHKNVLCNGLLLTDKAFLVTKTKTLNLSWLIESYKQLNKGDKFFTSYFLKLSGTSKLKKQIIEGKSEKEIRESWQNDINKFKEIRKKYLIYQDFN